MSRREDLEREIRDLQQKIDYLKEDIEECHYDIRYYQNQLEVKNNEFMDEFNNTNNEYIQDTHWGTGSGDIIRESWERRYELQDAKFQYEEEAQVIKSNLQDAKNRLRDK